MFVNTFLIKNGTEELNNYSVSAEYWSAFLSYSFKVFKRLSVLKRGMGSFGQIESHILNSH